MNQFGLLNIFFSVLFYIGFYPAFVTTSTPGHHISGRVIATEVRPTTTASSGLQFG